MKTTLRGLSRRSFIRSSAAFGLATGAAGLKSPAFAQSDLPDVQSVLDRISVGMASRSAGSRPVTATGAAASPFNRKALPVICGVTAAIAAAAHIRTPPARRHPGKPVGLRSLSRSVCPPESKGHAVARRGRVGMGRHDQ